MNLLDDEIDSAAKQAVPQVAEEAHESIDRLSRLDQEFGQFRASLQQLFESLFDRFDVVLELARPSAEKALVVLARVDRAAEGTPLEVLGRETAVTFKSVQTAGGQWIVHRTTIHGSVFAVPILTVSVV